MKIKKFNDNLDYPKINDYVICKDITGVLNNYIEDKVVQLIGFSDYKLPLYPYIIKYDLDEDSLNVLSNYIARGYDNAFYFSEIEILYFSEDKEELKAILSGKKFNI